MSTERNPTWEEVRDQLHAEDPELAALYEETEPAFQVAKELIRIRAERGLSQSEVARRMGTSPSVISRLENMDTRPTLATVFALATALEHRVEIRFVDEKAIERANAIDAAGGIVDMGEPLARGLDAVVTRQALAQMFRHFAREVETFLAVSAEDMARVQAQSVAALKRAAEMLKQAPASKSSGRGARVG